MTNTNLSEFEGQYFRIFREETAEALRGDFDIPLWSRIVLQACHDEPCILNCAIAISALQKSSLISTVPRKEVVRLCSEAEVHHQ